jgi:hypothetical protein
LLNICSADVDCLSHRLPPNTSVLPVFVVHVPAVSNLRGRLKQTYVLHGLIFRTNFLLRHVCSSARSYTDFPGLVQVAAEKERGVRLLRQKKVLSSRTSESYRDLGNRISKEVHVREPLSREVQRNAREVYSHL